jgi:iturin family lipopeptide synthetase B
MDLKPEALGGLRVLISGGEAASLPHFRKALRELPHTTLINAYGPTENTSFSTWEPVQGPGEELKEVTIGGPIANSTAYVLDEEMQALPGGIVGELYVGGDGLARGYLKAAHLTAERFVPHPFRAGERLYRSGDRARWSEDGRLEFCGRQDFQVKIRGHRVELGEIESWLRSCPGVVDAAVVQHAAASGEKSLVAYLAGDSREHQPDPSKVREYLAGKCPSYMIPALVVVLDALPRQASGKLDRQALPAPNIPTTKDSDSMPSDETERVIAAAWQEALGVDRLGIDDDVFALGAHSLLTVRVHRKIADYLVNSLRASSPVAGRFQSRIEEMVAEILPLRALFDYPTVRGLAQFISGKPPENGPSGDSPPSTKDRNSIPPAASAEDLSHAQTQIWLSQQLDPHDTAYNVLCTVRLAGPLRREALERSLVKLVNRHESLRTSIVQRDDRPFQVIAPVSVSLPFTDLSGLDESERSHEAQKLAAETSAGVFQLECAPLFRLRLLRLAPEQHELLICLHHLITDGASVEILVRELAMLYEAESQNTKMVLPPLPTRYVDYARWQRDRLTAGHMQKSEQYWLETLKGLPEFRPAARIGGPSGSLGRHVETFYTSERVTTELRALEKRFQATLFMVLAAAFMVYLRMQNEADDVSFGTPVAGREHQDLENIVGCFINTVIFRTQVRLDDSFAQVLTKVRETALSAFEHQNYPFDLLVQKLRLERADGYSGTRVFFGTVRVPSPVRGGDITFSWNSPITDSERSKSAKFDLNAGYLEEEGKIRWIFSYNAAVFSESTAQRLTRQFATALDRLAGDPALMAAQAFVHEKALLRAISPKPQYALSWNQLDMWFQCNLYPDAALNINCLAVALKGPLDVPAFTWALHAVVERQDALETVFSPPSERSPYQEVKKDLIVDCPFIDCQEVHPSDEPVLLRKRAHALMRPFSLSEGPLFRCELLRWSEHKHTFILAFHNLILDGFHWPQLIQELMSIYHGRVEAGSAPASPTPFRYVDFAEWSLERFTAGELGEHASFWRSQLEEPLPAMTLPVDRLSGTKQTFELNVLDRRISGDLVKKVLGLRKRYRTTVFRTMVALFEVLLSRFTGENDLLIGMPFSTRPPEMRETVGFFSNTLPIRCRVDASVPFSRLLQDLSCRLKEAWERRDYPLVEAIRGARLERAGNHSLFRVTVSQIASFQTTIGELSAESVLKTCRGSSFDLWLAVAENGGVVDLHWFYSSERFAPSTIQRMARSMEKLLEEIVADPEKRIGELKLVGEEEERELVEVYAGKDEGKGESRSVIEALERQAGERGAEIAAVCGKERVSYAELNRQANQIGRRLRRAAVGKEEKVGVLGERGVGMLRAMLGIWKAGGAMVPLDAKQPHARLEKMVRSARVEVLLVGEGLEERGRKLVGAEAASERVVSWERGGEWEQEDGSNVGIERGVSDLAYVYYTSGSTGEPKGAMVEEGGLRNHLTAKEKLLGLDERSVIAQTASHCFDIAVWQLMAGLRVGGRVVIYDEETVLEPEVLLAGMEAEGVTVLETVPSLLPALLEAVERRQKRGQGTGRWRHLLSTGESLPVELCRRWLRSQTEIRLVNVYGPTECSDDVTHHLQEQEPEEQALRVPVGKPIAGAQIYVVDEELRLAPVGCPGEILIGGRCVGRGYSGEGSKTAETFVPDVYGEEGGRLYVTGDRGRWREGGELEFLGRRDSQVKVRGQRVELGEIEAVLAGHGGVKQVAVELRGSRDGEESGGGRLVAYWVGEEGLEEEELKGYVRERLGRAMQPESYVRMEQMPLTPNGKIDRRALPEPAERTGAGEYLAPRNEVEERIARTWQQVLGVDRVGIHDNFFALGGDSIIAIQVSSRLSQQGIRITPKVLFERQTVAELAQLPDLGRTDAEVKDEEGSLLAPLLPIQRFLLESQVKNPHYWNQAVLLRADIVDAGTLTQALQALVNQHDELRARFQRSQGRWLQHCQPNENVAIEFVTLSNFEELTSHAFRMQASLNVTDGPVFRAACFTIETGEFRILLVAHHLVVDLVSWAILLDDLETAYEQALSCAPILLPSKTSSYASWCARSWQSAAEKAQAEKEYWSAVLEKTIDLPTDHDLGPNTVGSTDTLCFSLDSPSFRALSHARHAYRTGMQDLVLTALARSLESWTGRSQHVVLLEGHGREECLASSDVTRTVGWFTSFYPIVLETNSSLPAHDAVEAVKSQLGSVPHRGAFFGFLRVDGQLDDRQPQIAFNYYGGIDRSAGDRLFSRASEPIGSGMDPENERTLLLNVECRGNQSGLEISIIFSRNKHRHETIGALGQGLLHELQLLAGTASHEPKLAHKSRFSLLGLDAKQIETLPNDTEDVYRLAPVQEGMLFHALYDPESPLYFEQVAFEISGVVDASLYERAWQEVVEETPLLRTVFRWSRLPFPVQVVLTRQPLTIFTRDLQGLEAKAQERAITEYCEQDWSRPYALDRGPLMRLALFRLGETQYRLVWSFHHIILDAWSTSNLLPRVMQIYHALGEGRDKQSRTVPVYRDYINWLGKQDQSAAAQFWKMQLSGFTLPTSLPVTRPAKPSPVRTAANVRRVIGEELAKQIRSWARTQRVTLSSCFRTVWSLLLSAMSGQSDVLFGVTVSGRPPELNGSEKMIGPLINTIPIRVRVRPWQTAASLAKEIQRQSAETTAFEYSVLTEVQKQSDVPTGTSLFNHLLVFGNYPAEAMSGSGNQVRIEVLGGRELTNYDLVIGVEARDRLFLDFTYAVDILDQATIEKIAGSMEKLLEEMVRDPEKRIGELKLVAEEEERELVEVYAGEKAEEGESRSVIEALERQAAEQGNRIAAVCGKERVSYAELNRQANQIGRRLQRAGVGREERVGVLGERGVGMLRAMLGIWKAGGAMVPLDAKQPDARLEKMIGSAGVGVLLVGEGLEERGCRLAGAGKEVVSWERGGEWEQEDGSNLGVERGASDLAYVYYTSGSTGEPKGAMVEEGGLRNHLTAKEKLLGLDERSVIAQTASHCFDIAVWQLMAGLRVGGRVVIYDEETVLEPEVLLAGMEAEGVTVLETVPSLLPALLEAVERRKMASHRGCGDLQYVISNAETLPVGLARKFLELLPDVRLLNTYGATECSDDTTHYVMQADLAREDEVRIAVGRSIPGAKHYVVDEELRLAPVGCPGEILIGGRCVGRGYSGEGSKTAETFVPDVYGEEGGRLYVTGDRGRWREGGELEFLGRRDSQVKVRGQRVELGEIEAVLAGHGGVKQVAVELRGSRGGEESGGRLVAYWVGEEGLGEEELKGYVREQLGRAMQPESYVRMEQMPLTPNGKIDRRALPEPAERTGEGEYVAPRNEVEERIARTWQQVLGVDRVGIHDNFFALGGDSIIAIRVIARLTGECGLPVTIRQLFQNPTIAELATALSGEAVQEDAQAVAEIPRAEELAAYPLSPAQEVQWLGYQISKDRNLWRPPTLLCLEGSLDVSALRAALQAVVDEHAPLRTSFTEVDGKPAQSIKNHAALVCPVDDLSHLNVEESKKRFQEIVAQESVRHQDLSIPPLLRARLVRKRSDSHVLILELPHIISDGRSDSLLLQSLSRYYLDLISGKTPDLPAEKQIRYVDYVMWIRRRLMEAAMRKQQEFWHRQFAVNPTPLNFATDGDGPGQGKRMRIVRSVLIPQEQVIGIKRVAANSGTTFFVVMLASFNVLLARLTSAVDIVVGTPMMGRGHVGLEDVFGHFLNVVPMRTNLSGDPTLRQVIERTKQVVLNGLSNQEYPFHMWLNGLRRGSAVSDSLYSVYFALQEYTPPPRFPEIDVAIHFPELYSAGAGSSTWHMSQKLAADCIETDEGWRLKLAGDSQSFSARRIEEFLEAWLGVIRCMVADPAQRSSSITISGHDSPARGGETAAHIGGDLDRDALDDIFAGSAG